MQSIRPIFFTDLETTGHDPLKRVGESLVSWHEIIEIGALLADPVTLKELTSFTVKVRPQHPERCLPNLINDYPRRAAAGEWDDAVELSDAFESMFTWHGRHVTGQSVPAGQNFSFDWLFYTVGFAECGIDESIWGRYLHYSRLDTRSMAVQALWEPGTPYNPNDYSLRNDALAMRLGIEPEPSVHEALNGARTALAVARALQHLKK
jgi:DNA polymerase III epsilon subunit-like protein